MGECTGAGGLAKKALAMNPKPQEGSAAEPRRAKRLRAYVVNDAGGCSLVIVAYGWAGGAEKREPYQKTRAVARNKFAELARMPKLPCVKSGGSLWACGKCRN